MGIEHLFGDTPPDGTPPPRLTPRSPISIKELIVVLGFIAAVGAIYDRMNKYAEKTDLERIKDAQTELRISTQHNFDQLGAKVDALIKASDAQQTGEGNAPQQRKRSTR
jgi:hypothetical protein